MFGMGPIQTWLIGLAGALVVVIGAAGFMYQHGYGDASSKLQPKIDVLTGVVAADEITIKQMAADAAQNDELLAQYTNAVDVLTKQAFADQAAIRELETHDKTVSAYLSTPVPITLRSLLNNELPSGVLQGSQPVTAKGAR